MKKETTNPIKVDFSKVSIQLKFEGNPEQCDIRHTIGNNIRKGTSDIGLDEIARTIYFSEGEVEIPSEYTSAIVQIINQSGLIVPIKQAISQLLIIKAEGE